MRADFHNWGGVLCGRAAHTGCCVEVGGRRLQRFSTDADGLRRLVELCCVYTGTKSVDGFRSELRSEGFFGPNEDAEKTFQELAAAWAGLEADFGAARLKSGIAKASYETWLAFRDKWQSGDADTTALGALVADVNVTRQNLGREKVDIRPPEVTQTTAALKAFNKTDAAAKAVTSIASEAARDAASATANAWGSVPLPAKMGAAVVAVVAMVLALFRVTR
ncbi:MAG: hypothetical protein R3B70_25980 [Polyangiaceae bacterium]